MGIMLWCTTVFYPRYKQPGSNATIAWDAAGYYWYLPSVFIYHDLADQAWADSLIREYQPGPPDISGFGFRAENGHVVMKYPAGMALVETPFFLIGHGLAKILGYPVDGFSRPYQAGIQIGALLVAFLGLWMLRRLLLFYYKDGVVALCLAVLVVGTNYLNYSAIDGSISHGWLFTLYVGLMLCSRRFYLKPTSGGAIGIGALCGLATLIRPTDIIACIIPLLWGLDSLRPAAVRQRFAFLWQHRLKLVLAALAAGCFIAVQLVYWKAVAGHWLVYSYQDQGFSWLRPHVFDYTFSYRSGWITYTPAMLLALIGAIPFLRQGPNRVAIAVFSAIAFYLVTAWDVWWYAGMGGRAMVQYYPALLFPMAALFTWLATRKLRMLIATPVVLLLVFVNIWFTHHAHGGSLYDSEGGMSARYYWRVIGRWSAPEETLKLRDGKYLYEAPMPATARLLYSNTLHGNAVDGGDTMLVMDATQKVSPDFTFAYKRGTERWLRAEAVFHCTIREPVSWNMLQFCLGLWQGKERLREGMVRVYRFLDDGETKTISVDLKLPHSSEGDSVNVHFWNVDSDKKVFIEQLKVWAF